MYSGAVGGLKTGTRLALWTGAFVVLEEALELGLSRAVLPPREGDSERPRATRWATGAVAGLGLAGAAGQICEWLFGLIWKGCWDGAEGLVCGGADRLSRHGGARRLLLGASLGALAGGSHDLRDWMKTKLPAKDEP